ncbi:MAG: hypothetical protein RL226_1954 [Bacteroidota bacterium]
MEELEAFKEEFIFFLSSNSIPASEWEEVKQHRPERANELIDLFSDIFWEKALSKIRAIKIVAPRQFKVIRYFDDHAEMVQLVLPEQSAVDFTNPKDLEKIASGQHDLVNEKPEFFKGTKAYEKTRNDDLFVMIEGGAEPCSEAIYNALKNIGNG